jgi:DnaK suppressor protein
MISGDSNLTPEQEAEIRVELERSLARLESSMKSSRRASRPVKLDQTAVGRLSRIDAIQNQEMSKGLQERGQAKSAQLREALRRLDDGTFGECEGCDGPIEFARLLVFPETRVCASCAR